MKRLLILLTVILTIGLAQSQADDPFASGSSDRLDVNLDAPAGTVAEFVDKLRVAVPELNFVMKPGGEDTKMPPMRLKSVDIHTVVDVVSAASGGQVRLTLLDDNMAVIEALETPKNASTKTQLAVFDASKVLQDQTVGDLTALIAQAFSLAGNVGDPPKFSLHKETMILMAKLTEDQHEIVHNLFAVLDRPKPVRGKEESKIQREMVIREISQLRARLESLREKESSLQINAEIDFSEREIESYMRLHSQLRAEELGLELPNMQSESN